MRPPRFELTEPDGTRLTLSSKTAPRTVRAGSRLWLSCAGAGGYGLPAERDLAAIQADLDDGYLSAPAAERDYGVSVVSRPDRADGPLVVRRP
jgi:N-methylhydantoinase B